MSAPAVDLRAAEEAPAPSRRRFLRAFIGLFTSLIGASVAVPFLGTLVGKSSFARAGGAARVGTVGSYPIGVPTDAAYTETGSDAFLSEQAVRHVWVVRRSETEVVAFSPICPHLGCRYDWNPGQARFECPCHKSVFGLDGNVLSGPAPRPLDALPSEVKQGALYVRWEQYQVGSPRKILI